MFGRLTISLINFFFRSLGTSSYSRQSPVSFVLSLCMFLYTLPLPRLLLDEFSWNLVLETFVKIWRKKSKFGDHWTKISGADFHEIWYSNIFLKSVQKIQDSLTFDKNNECFTWIPIYIFDHISLNTSWN